MSFLKESGYQVIVYFYNPNIYPLEEYNRRLEAQRILCSSLDIELIEGEYMPEEFYKVVKGLEHEPEKGERCDKCFELRLKKTAEYAKIRRVLEFTTSIGISPHKDFSKLSSIGQNIARNYGLKYLDIDFKKKDGFLKTNQMARSLGLYRQNYCGCEWSKR